MFINPEGFKAIMDTVGNSSPESLSFTKVNKDFEEKAKQSLRGEKFTPTQHEDILKRVLEMKKTIAEGTEGFIEVDEQGREKK